MIGSIDPPCGVPEHRMGRWENEILGIWWCPDCGEEIWATEGVDDEGPVSSGAAVVAHPAAACDASAPVPDVRAGAADGGDPSGAPCDRAPEDGFGWRDRDGGAHLWHLILDAFGRAAS